MNITEMVKRISTEIRTSDEPLGTYNPELDKFEGIDLFPKKTAKAREMLKNAPLPPELLNRQTKK
jgi:hypothetical protein